jgi:hypothetical protein
MQGLPSGDRRTDAAETMVADEEGR